MSLNRVETTKILRPASFACPHQSLGNLMVDGLPHALHLDANAASDLAPLLSLLSLSLPLLFSVVRARPYISRITKPQARKHGWSPRTTLFKRVLLAFGACRLSTSPETLRKQPWQGSCAPLLTNSPVCRLVRHAIDVMAETETTGLNTTWVRVVRFCHVVVGKIMCALRPLCSPWPPPTFQDKQHGCFLPHHTLILPVHT